MSKPLNILLVNPWIHDFKAFDLWMKPLGLLYISSILKKNGHNVRLIDCLDRRHPDVENSVKFRNNGTGKFFSTEIPKPDFYRGIPRRFKRYGISTDAFMKDLLQGPQPDMVFVTSMMSYWYEGPFNVIKIIGEVYPDAVTVLGGVAPSLMEEFYRENSGAHLVISGTDPKSAKIQLAEKTGFNPDNWPESFADFPPADFSHYGKLDYGVILGSVGCPFRCSYCASGLLWPHISKKSPGRIINEIKILAQRNITNFAFYDDALLMDRENQIKPLLRGIIDEFGGGFSFYTPNGLHARYLDSETAVLMKKSGFKSICLSLETDNPELAKKTGGKISRGQLEEALENLFKAGFDGNNISIYLMMGIPGQTREQVEESLEYVRRLRVQNRLSYYSPVPGTADCLEAACKMPELYANPLFHNNTYQYYMGLWQNAEVKRELKEKANRYTREVIRASSGDLGYNVNIIKCE